MLCRCEFALSYIVFVKSKSLFGNCVVSQNFHTGKSSDITVFYAVLVPYYPAKACRAFIKDN